MAAVMWFFMVMILMAASDRVAARNVIFDHHSWRTTFFPTNDTNTSTTITGCLLKNDTIQPFPVCHNHQPTSRYCSCSDDCWITRNCCLSFQHGRRAVENAKRDPYSCTLVRTTASFSHQIEGHESFALVSRCPHTWHRTDIRRSACETNTKSKRDHLLSIPVTDIASNISYRNFHCALCHGVREYIFWNTSITCRKFWVANKLNYTQALHAFLVDDRKLQCQLVMNPPINVATPPKCSHSNHINTCPTEWTHEDEDVAVVVPWLCATVFAPLRGTGNKGYRNEYCLACHGTPFEAFRCPERSSGDGRKGHNVHKGVSFSLLFDFRGEGPLVGMSSRCSKDHVYDVFKKACRVILCGHGHFIGNTGHCERLMSADSNNSESNNGEPNTTAVQQNETRTSSQRLDNSPCSKAMVTASEYDSFQLSENGTLTITDHGRSIFYGPHQYQHLTNESVILCFNPSDNYVAKFPKALNSLTVAGSCLSITALAIKIALYAALPSSRNMPMTIVLCLSLSLLVGQFLFLVAGVQKLFLEEYLCFTVAIAIHYSFLAAFSWMNVLSFDLWRTFSKSSSAGNAAACQGFLLYNRFRKYSAYAWILPAVVVASAIVMDTVIETPYFRPSYGAVYCMISSRTGLLVFFVAPMGALLLTNVAFFIGTALAIRETTRIAKIASVKKSQGSGTNSSCRFLLYMKLASIMGVTWTSAFVAAYADVEVLWYVFVAFNSIQGVYVLVAFTPYRRVMRRLRRRFPLPGRGAWLMLRHRSLGKQRSTSSTSSTNTSTRVTSL